MSSEFWAGYVSGAVGIVIGNPLDVVKVRLQAGKQARTPKLSDGGATAARNANFVKGVAAPILGYGGLNALLFYSYTQSLEVLESLDPAQRSSRAEKSLRNIWLSGIAGGLATWVISAPTEVVKCRTQLESEGVSSFSVARSIWQHRGVQGFYLGGGITSVRDGVGYAFYFWSYEYTRRLLRDRGFELDGNGTTLFAGGLAGIVSWMSIFPLDVIKTRVQSVGLSSLSAKSKAGLLARSQAGAFAVAREAYANEGLKVFFRGSGICALRAFIVNAVQWFVYERSLEVLKRAPSSHGLAALEKGV